MKIPFELPSDGAIHRYWISCFSESVETTKIDGQRFDYCRTCEIAHPRSIIISPTIVWWIDNETGEYWHESVGVFMVNAENQILLFERTNYPFSFAIPAGHLDVDETPLAAAKREVEEEVGVSLSSIVLIAEEDVVESCRGGSDHHRWHLYAARYISDEVPAVIEEGRSAAWVPVEEALAKENLNVPTRYFLERYREQILSVP